MIFAPTIRYPESPIDFPDDLDYRNLEIAPRLADLALSELHVLNLGAGDGSGNFAKQIQELPCRSLVNVELFDDALWKLSHYPNAAGSVDFIHQDMLEYCRMARDASFDVILVIDAIEHLTREQGLELLGHLKRIARKLVLIWVPFGECEQHEYGGNPLQEHGSTWLPEDFEGAKVEVLWRHFHIPERPLAGWVTLPHA